MSAPTDPVVLEFGSRAGSFAALAFFAAVFGAVGWAVARALRQPPIDLGPGLARAAGALLWAGPVALVYVTSIAGFYRLELAGDVCRLHGLLMPATAVRIADVATIRPVPFHRGTWRLRITEESGRRHESATSSRDVVTAAVERLETTIAARGAIQRGQEARPAHQRRPVRPARPGATTP